MRRFTGDFWRKDIDTAKIEARIKSIAVLFLSFAIFNLDGLTSFTLSVDDEFAAFRENAAAWVAQGRWTIYLWERFVVPQPVLPFLPLALFGLFCAAGYLLFLRALGRERMGLWSLLAFPLFSAFPTWAFLTAFQSNTAAAGLGVFLCCWSAFLLRAERERAGIDGKGIALLAAAALTGAAAIGCYQSFALDLAVMFCLAIVAMAFDGRMARAVLVDCLAAGAVLIASLAIYALLLKLFMKGTQTDVSYIQGFVRLDDLFNQPGDVLSHLVSQMRQVYFGKDDVYGYKSPAVAVLLVMAAVGMVLHARRIAATRGAILGLLAVVVLLLAPFGMNLMSGGSMHVRSLVAVPTVFAGMVLLGFPNASGGLKRIGFVALLVLYFSMFKTLAAFNATRDLVQVNDRQMALALSERVARLSSATARDKPLTIDVFGFRPFKSPYSKIDGSTIGASFFEWDRGNPYRMVTYLKLIGLPIFDVVRPERRPELLDEFVDMPPWPAEGAVRVRSDGVVLVKLSDIPNPNYRDLLSGDGLPDRGQEKPFFSLSDAPAGKWSLRNGLVEARTGSEIALSTVSDPQLIFETGDAQLVKSCSRIELRMQLKVERPTGVQIFYKPPGQGEFNGETSADTQIAPAPDGGFVDIRLQIISRTGFADSFRLDPVDSNQRVTIRDMQLLCRHSRPGI